jgi:hypothetical protein
MSTRRPQDADDHQRQFLIPQLERRELAGKIERFDL